MRTKLALMAIIVMVLVNVTSVFGQEKTQTKSLLNEFYKQNLMDRMAQLRTGKVDIDKVAEQVADTMLRSVLLGDAELVFDAIDEFISNGKVRRPKLSHESIDGKNMLSRSTTKSYDKCFQAFMKGLPRNMKKTDYDTFVAKNKTIVLKAKKAFKKQFKKDVAKYLDVKTGGGLF